MRPSWICQVYILNKMIKTIHICFIYPFTTLFLQMINSDVLILNTTDDFTLVLVSTFKACNWLTVLEHLTLIVWFSVYLSSSPYQFSSKTSSNSLKYCIVPLTFRVKAYALRPPSIILTGFPVFVTLTLATTLSAMSENTVAMQNSKNSWILIWG